MSRSRVELIPASPAHVGTIANRMRPFDVLECRAMGRSPKQALRIGLRSSSLAFTALIDGRPEAMMGLVVTNALCGEGTPWMLATETVYDHPRAMLVHGRRVIKMFFDSTRRQTNLVSVENDRAIRFLRRCGFTINDEEAILHRGVEFFSFEAERG